MIKAKRDELSSQNSVKEDLDQSSGIKRKMALLDLLLQATIDGKPLSNMDIREEVGWYLNNLIKFIN